MFKYKKTILYLCTFLYIVFFIIEFIKYMFIKTNVFGLIYLILNLIILFLLIPTTHNYKKYFSPARISKLILIILLGIFSSYILEHIVLNNYSVIDSSNDYIKSIFIYKSVFKGILYFILLLITVFEFRVEKLLKSISKK